MPKQLAWRNGWIVEVEVKDSKSPAQSAGGLEREARLVHSSGADALVLRQRAQREKKREVV